jgi:tetratricopeptide (TPR) repeat protein
VWFEAELPCLQAAHQVARDHGWHTLGWQLPEALFNVRLRQGRLSEDLDMWRAAIEAAERLTDPAPHAVARLRLGQAGMLPGQYGEARTHLERALTLFGQTRDVLGQGEAHFWLGITWELQDDPERGLACHERALHHYEAVGSAIHEAGALNAIGWCHARLGRHEQAHGYCERALAINRTEGDRYGEALNLETLGYSAHHRGHYHQALDYHHQSLTMCREAGATWSEPDLLEHIGDTHQALGQHTEARDHWQQALDLCHTQHRTTQAARVQQRLDALDNTHTDPPVRTG